MKACNTLEKAEIEHVLKKKKLEQLLENSIAIIISLDVRTWHD
jgi:hypothetical protein